MMSRDVHYWLPLLRAAFSRRQERPARKPVSRCRSRSVPDVAAPIPVRATSPKTGKIPICWCRRSPITARCPIYAFLSRTLMCGRRPAAGPSGHGTRAWDFQEHSGVNMRLNAGGIRELHWHKAAEWAYLLYGTARITAIDAPGHNFVDDVGVGDLWYFASGVPHSIQGLNPDGCEFLLVFDDGEFDEDNTFLLSDWFKHTPREVLSKNFGVSGSSFAHVPDPSELYIFAAPVPGPLSSDRIPGGTQVPQSLSHKMLAQ